MSVEPTSKVHTSPAEAAREPTPADHRLRWFELCLVLFISCGDYFLSSLRTLAMGRNILPYLSSDRWTSGILHEVICLALLGYVLSRRKLSFRDLGLTWSFGALGSGLLVGVLSYLSYGVGYSVVHAVHHAFFSSTTSGVTFREMFAHPTWVAIPFGLLNPFFEELIVRAYLMTEVQSLTGSTLLAVAMSVVVQTSYHLYYGWQGALSLSFQFLVFSIYYARTRRATPIIVAHGIFDIWALARIW